MAEVDILRLPAKTEATPEAPEVAEPDVKQIFNLPEALAKQIPVAVAEVDHTMDFMVEAEAPESL